MISKVILLLFFVLHVKASDVTGTSDDVTTCGYPSCSSGVADRLNVHIVCHSHDDVGWLKTVDQYYSGSYRRPWSGGEENQRAGVQYTLDTVVRELAFDPKKKFIQVETAFFWRWWNEQDQQMKDLVHELVNAGQIEFIGGGWCMNDEAAAHYVAIIDQMALGFKKLKDTFGDCGVPKVGWQIDPFGHSREQADIFASMGMDGLFFGRLDWREKGQRLNNKTAEMIWMTSDIQKDDNKLLTGVLFNNYSPPDDFCWDLLCNDEPLMDNPSLHDYNMEVKAQDFINYIRNQHKYYATNHILLTMGMDFHYQAAHTWYKNLDKLIDYINTKHGETEKLNLMYSTPLCYVKSLNEEGLDWPVKSDDFFPYASDPHAYWTGYFSSRPASKKFIRVSSGLLQFAKQLTSRAMAMDAELSSDLMKSTERLNRAVAVAQHHDAITGTEKQHVANDYHVRLHSAAESLSQSAGVIFCPLLNISQCEMTETIGLIPRPIIIYNPLGRVRTALIHLPVATSENWIVKDEMGKVLVHQITPLPKQVKLIPGRQSQAEFDLAFYAEDLPALNIKSFTIEKSNEARRSSSLAKKLSMKIGDEMKVSAGNRKLKVTITETGLIVQDLKLNISYAPTFDYYKGHRGNNTEFDFRASGAYVFRPLEQEPVRIPFIDFDQYVGPLFSEFQINGDNNASLIMRFLPDVDEFDWLVGPISVEDGVGKEYIARWITTAEFNQDGVFYTDANGRQTMKRVRDFRPSYDFGNATLEEPVSSNYYPINSAIHINDPSQGIQLAVLTDRAQGGTSMKDGQIELMMHRRLLDDDSFGVGEPLNEEAYGAGLVVRGRHSVLLGDDIEQVGAQRKILSNEIFAAPVVMFPALKGPSQIKKLFSPGQVQDQDKYQLPPNVNLLTLEPWLNASQDYPNKQYLVRLEHIFEEGEHGELSQPVTVELSRDSYCKTLLS